MKIIDTATRRGSGHNMHRITVEFADGRETVAVLYAEPVDGGLKTFISLAAACRIAGVSESRYRRYLRKHKLDIERSVIPAEINGTMQAREMVFTRMADMCGFLKLQGKEYGDILTWFRSIVESPLDMVIGFDHIMNPVEARRVGILSIPVDMHSQHMPAAPVHIDFDATGGIEQLNRIISSLDVPYQIRARALNIQNDFSQLANVIETLNDGGNA